MPTHIMLGEGKWITGVGIYKRRPGLVFIPAKEPGTPGSDVTPDKMPPGLEKSGDRFRFKDADSVPDGTVVITFTDWDATLRHLERMREMGEMIKETGDTDAS